MNKKILFVVLFLISIYFFYLGIKEKNKDYALEWDFVYGTIYDKKIENKKQNKTNKVDDVLVYKTIYKYRLKNYYYYYVNSVKYNGYFYNDGIDSSYTNDIAKIRIINNYHNQRFPLKIFYKMNNHGKSCLNPKNVKSKKVKLYYFIGFITFVVILISFIFSINNQYME